MYNPRFYSLLSQEPYIFAVDESTARFSAVASAMQAHFTPPSAITPGEPPVEEPAPAATEGEGAADGEEPAKAATPVKAALVHLLHSPLSNLRQRLCIYFIAP